MLVCFVISAKQVGSTCMLCNIYKAGKKYLYALQYVQSRLVVLVCFAKSGKQVGSTCMLCNIYKAS